MQKEIIMFTDGGSRGNPGPAGIGVYISAKSGSALGGETTEWKYGECIGIRTNNDAEYEALIFGLKKIKQLLGNASAKQAQVNCFLDSELVVKQLNHQYKLKEPRIQQYFLEIWNLMLEFEKVTFTHIFREKNKIADALVNEALDNERSKQSSFL